MLGASSSMLFDSYKEFASLSLLRCCNSSMQLTKLLGHGLTANMVGTVLRQTASSESSGIHHSTALQCWWVVLCTQCGMAIEKRGGCKYMLCPQIGGGCGYEFCWTCRLETASFLWYYSTHTDCVIIASESPAAVLASKVFICSCVIHRA